MIPNAVVHVPTEEELDEFVGFCERHSLTWCSKRHFARDTRWCEHRQDTVYHIEAGAISYSNVTFAQTDYLKYRVYNRYRPKDPRLFLCSVYDLIQIVEGGDAPEDEPDISFLDSLL